MPEWGKLHWWDQQLHLWVHQCLDRTTVPDCPARYVQDILLWRKKLMLVDYRFWSLGVRVFHKFFFIAALFSNRRVTLELQAYWPWPDSSYPKIRLLFLRSGLVSWVRKRVWYKGNRFTRECSNIFLLCIQFHLLQNWEVQIFLVNMKSQKRFSKQKCNERNIIHETRNVEFYSVPTCRMSSEYVFFFFVWRRGIIMPLILIKQSQDSIPVSVSVAFIYQMAPMYCNRLMWKKQINFL